MTGLISLGPTRTVRRNADGEGAGDVSLFAATVLGAATAGRTEEALKLYDQGVATFGPAFRQTYYDLRDAAEDADTAGPLKKVESIPTSVGIPTSVVSPREGERLASGLRTLDISPVDDNTPDAPVTTSGLAVRPALGSGEARPNTSGVATASGVAARPAVTSGVATASGVGVRTTGPTGEAPVGVVGRALDGVSSWLGDNVKIGEGAVDTNTPDDTGYRMTLNGLPRTERNGKGLLGLGGFPGAGRSGLPDTGRLDRSLAEPGADSITPPGQPAPTGPQVDLDRALSDPAYRESLIPTPGQPMAMPRDTTQLPILRPDRNEANTVAGQSFRGSAKEEAVARGVPLEQVEAERAAELDAARAADAPPSPAAAPAPSAAATNQALAATPAPSPAPSGLPAAPDMTGGYAPGGLSSLPVPAEAGPSFSFRTAATTAGRSGGVPRVSRPIVAPRTSGGLASMAGQAPSPAPSPAPPAGWQANGPPVPLTPQPAAPAAPEEAPADDKDRYWEALIAAGLGTMASQNSSALGAIGEGGLAGVQQLGQIRKEMRDEKRDKSDAQYRKESIGIQREGLGVQREGIASQDRRAAETIAAQERMQRESIASQERLLNQKLANDLTVQGMQIGSQYDLLNARAEIEMALAQEKQRLENAGIEFKRENAMKFLTDNGLSKDTAALAAVGFAPTKADKPSPMGEKETVLTHDLVAGALLGEGATGQQLIDQLPPQAKQAYFAATGARSDPSSAAAAGIAAIKGAGLVPKDTSTFGGLFGKEMELTQPQAPAAYQYVPGKGLQPK